MTDSLRDLLLKSGLARSVPKAARAPKASLPPKQGRKKPASGAELDLAKAYALRSQSEAAEKKRLSREAEAAARAKKERLRKLQALLPKAAQNKADAEHVRHFEYRGKIRRIYVDAAQLAAINVGGLGVAHWSGRFLVVSAEVATQVAAIDADVLALLVDPQAPVGVDADGVPDDLIW
ncbi:MAG: DUF2058 family protein [Xanthomonadales bacterium]|nr:DUF2058 family protein [Xanthomonadales bacterium]